MRRLTPRLEEAKGERRGSISGSDPAIELVGLGESPMAAVGLADQAEGLLPQLAAQVASDSGRCVIWRTAAASGATARSARERLLPDLEAGPVDFVVVGLGVNDSLALSSARRWSADLVALLDAVGHRLEPGRVILAGVPPMRRFPSLPFPLSAMLGARASLLDTVARRLAADDPKVVHAPMEIGPGDGDLFCRDGFHPGARAHREWARQLAQIIRADL